MFDLHVGASPDLSYPLGSRALVIGRAPGVDILLSDDAVSGRHAAVWTDGVAVYVQDLRSRNGVRVNDVPVVGVVRAAAGDRILIGRTELGIRSTEDPVDRAAEPVSGLQVEDLGTGLACTFADERLRIGGGVGVDLRVQGAPDVVLLRVGVDEVLLGVDDDMRPLRVGEPFSVGAYTFVLRRSATAWNATQDLGGGRGRYVLEATLEGGPGPRAKVLDRSTGLSHVVEAENRATLLWILARRRAEDLARGGGAPEDDAAGWVGEAEVLTSVWGRAEGASPTNLRVLVCRVRRDLREAGLDPWFLEQRGGRLRARVAEVVLW